LGEPSLVEPISVA
jgi:plasmid stabilization system protein ParE/sporulation protein YlmC with PRC-barrel domain